MREYLRFLWKKKNVLLTSFIVFFVLGYFVSSYIYNNNQQEFIATVEYQEEYEILKDETFFRASAENVLSSKGARLITDEQIVSLWNHYHLETFETGFEIHLKAKYLNYNTSRSVKLVKGLCNPLPGNVTFMHDDIVHIGNTVNPYLIGVITMSSFVFVVLVFLSILFLLAKDKEIIQISDNEEIFNTPFHKKYWKWAINRKLKVKDLCIIAVLFAMMMICKAIKLPSGFSNLGLSLTYLFFATIAWLYGPIIGLSIGFASDILGFFLFPTGMMFYFPYTLNAMITGFLYGIFFYRTKITFSKVFYCRVIVNLFVNTFLGAIWWGQVSDFTMDQTITYMMFTSLPKNLVYLLPQSILLYFTFKGLARVFQANKMLDYRICENITLF